MDWERVKAAFFDELGKMAQVDLSGVKAETSMAASAVQPMETSGLTQARRILSKVASDGRKRRRVSAPTLVPTPYIPPSTGTDKPTAWGKAKNLGAHTLGGMGAGRLISELTPKGASPKRKFIGTAVGGVVGAADYAQKKLKQIRQDREQVKTSSFRTLGLSPEESKKLRKHLEGVEKGLKKTATLVDPMASLKASQKIGRFGRVATNGTMNKAGPGLKAQVPLIGRTGTLPGVK